MRCSDQMYWSCSLWSSLSVPAASRRTCPIALPAPVLAGDLLVFLRVSVGEIDDDGDCHVGLLSELNRYRRGGLLAPAAETRPARGAVACAVPFARSHVGGARF